ncbi:hypothetical protein AX14_001402 [Amanita brunnescens Koide BX004]|nr:hypothetical protein AX14_001402 [Amanita brunnescens Koide BX004]
MLHQRLLRSLRQNSIHSAQSRSFNSTQQRKTLPSFSLAEKVCLVTGAARGLGYEFCRAFIQSGCKSIAVLDLNGTEAKYAAQELEAYSNGDAKVIAVECDVASQESVQNAYARVIDAFHRVDSVVASAGIVENITALEYPDDRMKRLYDINVHGAFYTAREAAKVMIPKGNGSIILVSSMSATIVNLPQPQTPYNASKAAVKHMAASLAVEWAKTGVRVNALSPGYTLTKLTKTILAQNEELKKTWEQLTPMGRMAEPEDLAGAVVFLASDASKLWISAPSINTPRYFGCGIVMSMQPANASKGPQTFEFTKRKRWADLLAAELADVIILILSPAREILYCGNAVTELLGWRVLDLLDHDLLDLIPSPDDQLSFCTAFQHSVATNIELLSYLRFKSNSPSADELSGFKELLFELKGYPHFVNDECRCFFAMAKPYPSRNTSMLNTFLELKMEHERLRHRLTELRSQLPPRTSESPPSIPTTSAIYATSTIPSQGLVSVAGPYSKSLDHPRYALSSANYEDIMSGSRDVLESTNYGLGSLYSSSAHPDEESEEGVKKKKLKKSHSAEQYVCITCGRTDSPEWRKGPLGPKTLCNACGLRWAKQMRKYDEPIEGAIPNALDAPSN